MARTNQTDLASTVQGLLRNSDVAKHMVSHGMFLKTVSWEDTARTKGSCFGPNISDMTLATFKNGKRSLMPFVSCGGNFEDKTLDVPIDQFFVPIHNFVDGAKKGEKISLKDFLKRLPEFTKNDKMENMFLDRDERIMVKTQACFLPCDEGDNIEFGVQMFNYQSYNSSPAVMTIMVSKDGTSVQVLGSENELLYFNQMGNAHQFNAERLGDVRTRRTGIKHSAVKSSKDMSSDEKEENVLMIFQIPLKVEKKTRGMYGGSSTSTSNVYYGDDCEEECESVGDSMVFGGDSSDSDDDLPVKSSMRRSVKESVKIEKDDGTDMAVLSLGEEKGKYKGTVGDFKVIRDERFPIRCTFQYYRVCKTNMLQASVIEDIAHQLKKVEEVATGKGSHVLSTDHTRLTKPDLSKPKDTDSSFGKLEKREEYLDEAVEAMIKKEEPKTVEGVKNKPIANFLD